VRITITVDEPTPEFQDKLLALLAEHAGDVETDATWTEERATHYYRMLPPRARRIVREAVQRGGMVPADVLRDNPDDSLRGHSAPLSRILQRGTVLRRWPEGMKQPVSGVGPGFGKVEGYEIAAELIPVFETAIRTVGE
jgi:(2Fe-2S) ferredoxin